VTGRRRGLHEVAHREDERAFGVEPAEGHGAR
jgi:hypothetical protein